MTKISVLLLASILLSSCCSSDQPAGRPNHKPWYYRMWFAPC